MVSTHKSIVVVRFKEGMGLKIVLLASLDILRYFSTVFFAFYRFDSNKICSRIAS